MLVRKESKVVTESTYESTMAKERLYSLLQLPQVSVLYDGKRFKLVGFGDHNVPILVDTGDIEYGNYGAYYPDGTDEIAREGCDSPERGEKLAEASSRSYYDEQAKARITPSIFDCGGWVYRVVYFQNNSNSARSAYFKSSIKGIPSLPDAIAKIGYYGKEMEDIFGKQKR